MRSFRPNISLPGLLVFFIALLLGLGFALFPWMSDDLWYRLPFKDFILHGAPFDTDTLLREIRKHHLTDNSRLANVAMALLQFLPGWFTASLSALAAFATMSLMRRYGAFAADTAATALFCGLFALVMPWIDQMYVFDFQLNYLWAGMLMALLLYLLAQGRCAPDALFLTGLLTGVWQECTAFPLFVALLASAALYRRCRTHRCGAAVLGLLLGLMWLYFSPGGSVYRSASWTPFGFRLGILAVFVVPVAVYTAMLLPSLWRRRCLPLRHFILLAMAWSSAAVLMLTTMGPRTGWASVLASITGITMLVARHRRSTVILGALCYGLALANLATVCYVCQRERQVYNSVIKHYQTHGTATAFVDISLRENAPQLALQKPQYDFFAHYNNITLFSDFYGHADSLVRVVPAPLRHFTAARASAVPDGFYSYEGLLVGPAPEKPDRYVVEVDYGGGVMEMCYFTTPFTDADGIERGWYHCDASTFSSLLHPVPDYIRFLEVAY